MADRRAEAVAALQSRLGHHFADAALLEEALTHASVAPGRNVRHNERLEFLGDRVLGLLVAQALIADTEADEGEMSRRLHTLVSGRTCAVVARRMGLGDALRLGPSEVGGGRNKDSILGDACEALIAALYLDGGLDVARSVFDRFWFEDLEKVRSVPAKDPKTRLQEWAQARGLGLPTYEVLEQTGPAHAPHFKMLARIEGLSPQTAEGGSRREAERLAAQALLEREGDA